MSKKIKVGDITYNPLSNVVVIIDEDDDLKYADDNYFKVSPEDLKLTIDSESVNIYFNPKEKGTEPLHVCYWNMDEVEEDSSVAMSMVNAVQLFYTNKKELLERVKCRR